MQKKPFVKNESCSDERASSLSITLAQTTGSPKGTKTHCFRTRLDREASFKSHENIVLMRPTETPPPRRCNLQTLSGQRRRADVQGEEPNTLVLLRATESYAPADSSDVRFPHGFLCGKSS
jgi:hypothetical protein